MMIYENDESSYTMLQLVISNTNGNDLGMMLNAKVWLKRHKLNNKNKLIDTLYLEIRL